MGKEFEGNVAVVTGGGNGIGRAIANAFACNGAHVAIWESNQKSGQAVCSEIERAGTNGLFIQTDVTVEREVERAVTETLDKLNGRIDILVNNAGISGKRMIESMPVSLWHNVLNVNLTGAFICSKVVLPVMKKQRYGRIVNISSISAKRIAHLGGAAYTSAKTGLLGFTRHMACEVGTFGITVNAICPGPTKTDLMNKLADPAELDTRVDITPLGRLATPQDHAYATLFFASERAEFITGQALDVDGGILLAWYDYKTYEKEMKMVY